MKNGFKPTTKKVIGLLSSTTLVLSILLTIVLMKDHTRYYLGYVGSDKTDNIGEWGYSPETIVSCEKGRNNYATDKKVYKGEKQNITFQIVALCKNDKGSESFYKLKRA